MALIDRNKLLCDLCKWDISRLYLVESFRELIEEQPTVYDVEGGDERCETCKG